MKTWKLENGDVAINLKGRVDEVSRTEKVSQDLRHWLLNDKGFNKWHLFMGTYLDSYVGQPVTPNIIMGIREEVRNSLNRYMDEQISDLKKRIDERGDPYLAIREADPSSIVRAFTKLEVGEYAGSVVVRIGFTTHSNDYEEVLVTLAGNIFERGVI